MFTLIPLILPRAILRKAFLWHIFADSIERKGGVGSKVEWKERVPWIKDTVRFDGQQRVQNRCWCCGRRQYHAYKAGLIKVIPLPRLRLD